MVKIGALIGAIFTTIGAFLQIVMFSTVISGSMTWQELGVFVGVSNGFNLGIISILLFYLGLILVIGSGFIQGTLFLKIGGAVMIIGFICKIVAWMSNGLYSGFFNIGAILMFLGIILYFIGCIQYRKHNKVAIITGLLLFIIVLAAEIIIGSVIVTISSRDSSVVEVHFGTLIIQSVIFALHAWVFGFSKKRVSYDDDVEDTLSVESGGAFASYVPDDMKKKEKKRKKQKEDDEITFTF